LQGRLLNERHKSGLVLPCTFTGGHHYQNKSNTRGKQQQTKQKQPPEQNKGSGDSQSVHGLIQAVTTLCHHTWYGHQKQQTKQKTEKKKPHQAIQKGERSNTAYAETRDLPSQDPRDHIAQPVRHNNSPSNTSKQTTATPCPSESGEKKGETDSFFPSNAVIWD